MTTTNSPAGRPWRFDVAFERNSTCPLYHQLATSITHEIRRGRLAPGTPLPGARSLAAELNVTRKVVSAALDELCAQGWLVAKERQGTFVASTLPSHAFADATCEAAPASVVRTVVRLDDGTPDAKVIPLEALSRAYRDSMRRLAKDGRGYGDPRGDPVLRRVLPAFVNQARGLVGTPERVIATRGSQMALFLACSAIVPRGGCVVVESPGYRPAWQAFELAGANLAYVPVDEEGLSIERLRSISKERRIYAVYTTPHHQYPTTVSLSAERRAALLALAKEHDFTIIEDDYDCEYQFSANPALPLCAADEFARVVYVGSFSKLLVPGIRLGYLFAGEEVITRAAATRAALDRVGDPALERAVAYLLEDGEVQRHARRSLRVYARRREYFVKRLREDPLLSTQLDFQIPSAGLALWLRARTDVDMESWSRRAARIGLEFTPGTAHTEDGRSVAAFRAGYASLEATELDLALKLLAESNPLQGEVLRRHSRKAGG